MLKFLYLAIGLTACIAPTDENLIGDSDRPVDPNDDLFYEDNENGDLESAGGDGLFVENIAVEILTEEATQETLSASINESTLSISHRLLWDNPELDWIDVWQESTSLHFDYGDLIGETQWMTITYTVDVSGLPSNTYTIVAETMETSITLD